MDRPLTGGRFGFGTPNPPYPGRPPPFPPPTPTAGGTHTVRTGSLVAAAFPVHGGDHSDLVELVSIVCRCLIATTGVRSGCHVPEPPGGLLLLLAYLPPCLPAYRASCAPATPYTCASLPFGIHPSRLPAAPTAATANPFCAIQGKTHLHPSSSLTPPTYLSSRFRSVCQHWTTPSPPLPPLWFFPPPLPSREGQGAGLRRPSHLQLSQRALVVPSRHTSISCSTLPIHPFVAERAAEPCALSPKARWIPEVSISEPPSTRPRAKKNSRLVPAWWHWHTRSRLFGDP